MIGIGGHIERPEDFVVEEIINPKFIRKFQRATGKIEIVKGPYTLYILEKRNLTTHTYHKEIALEVYVAVKASFIHLLSDFERKISPLIGSL